MFKLNKLNPFKKKEKSWIDREMDELLGNIPPAPKPVAQKPIQTTKEPFSVPSPPIEPQEIKVVEKHKGFSWKEKNKLDKNPTRVYLITMIYGNGSCSHFVGEPNLNGMIKHRKKMYHINQKLCVWDANENNNRVYFHENYVEPLEIKEVQAPSSEEATDGKYINYVTPDNVSAVIRMESVRLIAEGPDLQKWLRITTFVSVAVLAILVIILIVFIAQSGIFQQITGSIMGGNTPTVGR